MSPFLSRAVDMCALHQSEGGKQDDHRGSAVGDKRQRHPDDRHQPRHHAHVDGEEQKERAGFQIASIPVQVEPLHAQIDTMLAQIAAAATEIQQLALENQQLRQEITRLEHQLAQKTSLQPA